MKKLLVVVVLLSMVSGASAEFPLSLGIKAGYNSSKFTVDNLNTVYYNGVAYSLDDVKSEMQNGFNVGLFARLQKGRLFFQPEAYVAVRKGSNKMQMEVSPGLWETGAELDFVTQSIEMSTLDVPILLGYRLLNSDVLKLSVFTGPSASIVLNEQVDFRPSFAIGSEGASLEGVSIGTELSENFDPEEEFKQANWNWQAGVGVDVGFVYADVRYEWGLNDIHKMDFVQKSNMLTFTLGFKLF